MSIIMKELNRKVNFTCGVSDATLVILMLSALKGTRVDERTGLVVGRGHRDAADTVEL